MKHLITFCLFFIVCITQGQNFQEQFETSLNNNDIARQKTILTNWEKSSPDDPFFNYYCSYYYLHQSVHWIQDKKQQISGVKYYEEKNKDGELWYKSFDSELLYKSLYYLNKGIEKNPNFYSLRISKIYYYFQIQDYTNYADEIVKLINQNSSLKYNWAELVTEESFWEQIYEYLDFMFNKFEEKDFPNILKVCDAIKLEECNNEDVINKMAVTYYATKKYQKCIDSAKKALEINIADEDDSAVEYAVMVAEGYEKLKDKPNAILYYQKAKECCRLYSEYEQDIKVESEQEIDDMLKKLK